MNTPANIHRPILRVRTRLGFTLIEVLLGVLILGLGLLGLASVFPLVVKKQRDAQDTVLGISSVKGVESVLRGHAGLNSELTDRGWAKFATQLKSIAINKTDRSVLWSEVLNAAPNTVERIYGNTVQLGELRPEPGSIVFWGSGGAGSVTPDTVILRTSDRLIPQGPGVTPQYVWDIVPILAGQLPTPEPKLPTIRVAMFVRRIDSGIRVPSGKTLTEVIAAGEAAAIAWDANRFPTFDGRITGGGSYAGFFAVGAFQAVPRFSIKGETNNILDFRNLSGTAELAAIRQVGQQLIDNSGNIYTVIALPQEESQSYLSEFSVVVSPPLSEAGALAIKVGGGTNGSSVQFLVSPVIPASVEVVDIRP